MADFGTRDDELVGNYWGGRFRVWWAENDRRYKNILQTGIGFLCYRTFVANIFVAAFYGLHSYCIYRILYTFSTSNKITFSKNNFIGQKVHTQPTHNVVHYS